MAENYQGERIMSQFTGVRLDSGNLKAWADTVEKHYKKFGIDVNKWPAHEFAIVIDTPFEFHPVKPLVQIDMGKVIKCCDLAEKIGCKAKFI